MAKLESLEFSTGEGDYRIHAHATICGSDVMLVVGGGTHPHIGSVATAISHPSLKDPAKSTSSASVIAIPGHKEDQIAREAALKLSRTLRTTVVVSAGLHVDDATSEEIEILVDSFNQLIEAVSEQLAGILRADE